MEKEKTPHRIKNLKIWDPVIIITVLSAVNIVYVLFSVIQFSYLFGSLSTGLPEEFTYSEYARQGFFELVFVTLINFGILLGSLCFTRTKNRATDILLRVLHTLLVGCTFVMLFSAHFRMSLYEEAYGYTYLRMFTHLFMILLFILLLLALYRIWNERFSLVKPYILAFIISFVIINYMNVDIIIARNNVNRYFSDKKIDMYYLSSLSYNAVQEIARLLEDNDTTVRQKAHNLLYEKRLELSGDKPWQSFNISKYRAHKYLLSLDLKPDYDAR